MTETAAEGGSSQRTLGRLGWLVAVGLIPVWWLCGWLSLGVIAFATQGSCYQPATEAGLYWARVLLPVSAAVMLVPWLVAATRFRQWLLCVVGLAASGLTLYWAVAIWMQGAAEWTNFNICF